MFVNNTGSSSSTGDGGGGSPATSDYESQPLSTPFVADSKAVAQDDANYQDALVDDAVQEAAAEASAEMADGTAV
ncbi:MAG: hypothetical protein ACREHD_13485, partial [Pirellulales bacterium]